MEQQLVAAQIAQSLGNASWIRRMFEAGIELKKQYGADAVCDFSLGNPDLPSPPEVKAALEKIAARGDRSFAFGYMPNPGYPEVRERVAREVSREQGLTLAGSDVMIGCGAAGSVNVLFHSILAPGDEVITPAPYFVEYGFYVGNHGGKLVEVPCRDFTFELDIDAIAGAITPRTRAVMVNSPNNPTGRIYTRAELEKLAAVLRNAEKCYGHPILLVSDEPYRLLNYEGVEIPGVLGIFDHAVVIGSYSKSLSLAGERVGFVALKPGMAGGAALMNALAFSNRVLGFVSAPAIGQQILLDCAGCGIDLAVYRERRQAMADVLDSAGIRYSLPSGAFYFFAKSPAADENDFIQALLAERILAVPGRGFGCAGYFRLAFCVDKKIIERSREGFRRAAAKFL